MRQGSGVVLVSYLRAPIGQITSGKGWRIVEKVPVLVSIISIRNIDQTQISSNV